MSSLFRLEFDPRPLDQKINIGDRIMLMGSCFTEHIYERLQAFKFQSLQNPHGVLFNPMSIFTALHHYVDQKHIADDELFEEQGVWRNWYFHSSLSRADRKMTSDAMNHAIIKGSAFLKTADWLILTLGSSFVYHFEDRIPVSNCHKVSMTKFKKRMMSPDNIVEQFEAIYRKIHSINPGLKWMVTISPVRHLRDGFVENNRSKAVLVHAVDKICSSFPEVQYFPSYELIIDDLRDYRFYAEDMVHPNYLATKYVWEKLVQSGFEGRAKEVMKELDQINAARQHTPLHPDSEEHRKFKLKFKTLVEDLMVRFPDMDLSKELQYFS
jgi:hypothetical protein